jgi:hypothetical protein
MIKEPLLATELLVMGYDLDCSGTPSGFHLLVIKNK